MSDPIPLLIDTDPGVDDALALLMALAEPGVRVLGLTVGAGNVGLEHTCRNALKLLEIAGRTDVPVHRGCAVPLLRAAEDAAFVHGRDGFGDTGYAPPRARESDEHAVLAILRHAREHSGRLLLVTLGPLTHLALALRLDPELPRRIGRLVMMGGAVTGRGNTRLIPAEFNIGFDPEAAAIVFEQFPHFELVDWEATLAHGVAFERFAAWTAGGDPRARFVAAISRKVRDFSRAHARSELAFADALAMAVALEPSGVLESRARAVAVECAGHLTRGATVVDWDERSGRPANATIVLRYDAARFERRLAEALGGA